MITMYDSIEISEIPPHAEAVAGYTGGKWATYDALVKAFPHAKTISIAIRSADDGEILDIENGDASPGEAPAWYRRQVLRKTHRPGFYCSQGMVNQLVRILEGAGIFRHTYRLWTAHYTGIAHVCGPHEHDPSGERLLTAAGATQFTDNALGRNLDESLCEDVFFAVLPPKPNVWQPNDELNWCVEAARIRNLKPLRYRIRWAFIRRLMLKRRKDITREAAKTGWQYRNRLYRYQMLAKWTD